MGAIFKREFRSYFTNMSGYAFIALFLAAISFSTVYTCLYAGYASFEYGLSNYITYISLMVFIPVLAMKSFAEDRRLKTDHLLFSLPIGLSSIVLGKFFALLAVFALPMAFVSLYPIVFSAFGEVSLLSTYTSLLGLFLLGAALISICMFLSTLSDSQIIAAVAGFGAILFIFLVDSLAALLPAEPLVSFIAIIFVSILIGLVTYLMTKNLVIGSIVCAAPMLTAIDVFIISPKLFEGLFAKILSALSLFSRFDSMTYGVLDLRAIVYFVSVSAFFVFLSVQSMEKKRTI